MGKPRCTEEEFIRLFEELGPLETARRLEMATSTVFARRTRLEKKIGRQITGPDTSGRATRFNIKHPKRQLIEIEDGVILVGSDAHYWPGLVSTAHRAFVYFARELKPSFIIKNGDEFDGASISRHPPIGWESLPTVEEEIAVCQERHAEIEAAKPRSCGLYWNLGNHDARFETRLATVAPEFARVNGVHLKDHFPAWTPSWSVWINDSIVVKHRFKGGIHAAHNNVLWSGKTIITGHLHRLGVRPFSDYNGVRFGCETGTMADPYGPQFNDYTEDNPVNWQSGFLVLTFRSGRLMWPEIVHVLSEGLVEFRGELIHV